MKILSRILLILFGLIFLILLATYFWLKTTAPTYEGELTIPGLKSEVAVTFDDFGVPHIQAQNAHDAYVSLGYVHAQERLFQMEMIRRATSGTLSEILGPSLVETDKIMRTLSIRQAAIRNAEKIFDQIDKAFKEQTMAYLQGINTFIDEAKLPIEFKLIGFEPEHFNVEDVYTSIGYMSLSFTSAISEEPLVSRIHDLLGNDYLIDFGLVNAFHETHFEHEEDQALIMEQLMGSMNLQDHIPVPIWEGSNNWVLSKERSKSGKTLLANDTHIKYSQPAVWFEAQLSYPGFEMFGYYLAGVPFAVIGHNKHLAWGVTIFPFDNMDLYRETQNPDQANEYWVDDHWETYLEMPQTIKVMDGEEVIYPLKYSRHGPIINDVYPHISDQESQPISLWWSLHTLENNSLMALHQLNNAQHLYDFEQAMKLIDIIGLNVVYADSDDNIAWWAAGKIPIRPEYVNSKMILDGGSGENEILGYYAFEENPQSVNPECGFITTANDVPPAVNNVVYPGYYAPGLRAARVAKMLNTRNKWDMESMRELQLDNLSERDTMLVRLIMSSLKINQIKSEGISHAQALKVLADWDGRSETSSLGATVYNQLLYHILYNAMADELGAAYFDKIVSKAVIRSGIQQLLTNEHSLWWDNVGTDDKMETRAEAFEAAMMTTIASLKDQLGENVNLWQWGKVHTLTHIHPIGRKQPFDLLFNVGPFEKSGSNDVIDKESFKYNSSGTYAIGSGPAMRFLIDFADPEHAWSVIPTGQSGNIMSPHYDDQARMFVKGEYRVLEMNRADRQYSTTLRLLP